MTAHSPIPKTIDELEDELERKARDAVEGRSVERIGERKQNNSTRYGRAAA